MSIIKVAFIKDALTKAASTKVSRKLKMQNDLSDERIIRETLKTIDNPYLRRKVKLALVARSLLRK